MNRNDPSRQGTKSGNAGPEQAWPLKLFIFGEFAPRDPSGLQRAAGAPALAVDKDSLDEAIRRLACRVSLNIPDPLSQDGREQWIDLPLEGIQSFHPEAVANAVPKLRALLDARKQVSLARDKKLPLEDLFFTLKRVRGAERILEMLRAPKPAALGKGEAAAATGIPVESTTPSTPVRKVDLLDSILDRVDLPGAVPPEAAVPAAATDIGRLIERVGEAGPSESVLGANAARELIREVDGMLSVPMNLILSHPEFRRLESLWRGLKLLVERTDFREPIRIEIRNAAKQDLPLSYGELSDQITSEGGVDADTIVLAVYEFDRSSRDLETLRRLAEISEGLQMPLITAAGLDFLGLGSAMEVERLASLGSLFDRPEYSKWRALRESEASRWLTLVFNRFLLRFPYGPEQVRVRAFEFSESWSAPSGDACLWGNPVWAVASLLTRRFAATGWCLEFTGWVNGLVEDLPIREIRLQTGESGQNPLEVMLDENHRADLARAGVAALVSRINTDSAAVLAAPTVHAPERYADPEETRLAARRVTLAFQCFVSRMTACARRLAGAVAPGLSPETVRTLFREILPQFFPGENNAAAVEVEVRDSERLHDSYDVHLTFWPEHAGLALPPVRLRVPVGK